jgi:PAS domain S-box-containing protein
MSWITIAWSMNAGACFVLAAVYFVVWCNQRDSWPHLLFACSAVAAAVMALIELAMLHSTTVDEYAALIRWIHVPVWLLTLSFVAFVRLYLRAGRAWLAWSIYGLRTVVLIINFISTPNINFRAISGIRHFSWWGEIVSAPIGAPNPWALISNLSLLLLLIFSVDATITVWRRGDRQRALVVGGSMILGAIISWHVPLVIWGVIDIPFFLSFAYSGIVLAMSSELGNDMFQTAQLAHRLERSEQRLNMAAESANFGVWEWDLNKDEVSVTRSRRDLLGLPPGGKIRFEQYLSRVHVDDRDRIRQAITEAIEKGKVYDSEFRIVLSDGSVRWITARGTVQTNKQGKPRRMLGISLDVTPRKEAELQTRQQRAELEQLRQQKTALLEKEVVERARLEREVIESCGREQRRIAYDLHDGVGQQLVGIALSAKLLEQELRDERPAQARKASAIVRLANETARLTRLTARSLEGADGVGDLKVALEALAANARKNCRVAAKVTADSSFFAVSAPVAAQLYRIVQEALHNAVEHGRAHKVQIDLTVDRDNMVLTVRDDGKGFDGSSASNGMGLRIMRYRAQCIGGSCEVQSNPPEGTIVTCRVPLQADAHIRPIP